MEEIFREIVSFIRQLYDRPEEFIPLHEPVFNGNEKKYLEQCIDTSYVSSVGIFVDRFEAEIADFTGAKRAVACVNGTSALHLALKLAGVEPGSEVITQPLTFVATANAILYCGALPVFLDVDRDTMGMSPDGLSQWLKNSAKSIRNRKTGQKITINKFTGNQIAACVPMHTFGHVARVDEILEICKDYSIPVVEDAAESLGSFFKSKHSGTFGMIGVLSFNGNKILTSGGGGVLLFNDEILGTKAKHLSTQAKVAHPWEFFHDEPGYNYRMPNINAALALAQLEKLPEFLDAKRTLAGKYREFFAALGSATSKDFIIHTLPDSPDSRPNHWLNSIFFPDKDSRNAFLKYSAENGIMTRPAWTLMTRLPMFAQSHSSELKNAEKIADTLVNLPSSVNFIA
jgi:perosamine synthetase